ncbi:MAG: helix-turn-helix transcriptional regulator [Polynucleobacter sp.]|nr:helix-turn-helix transcriptional regulator [Polynucleobacter sp.]MDZ4056952.1 helix-turn-helix transcriptional regulator [Polynucleobacter sp.]
MDYPIKTIAQLQPIVQGFRKATGMSQTAVAKKLGITQQSYAEFELNPQLASTERLFRILRLFNVEISLSHKADSEAAFAGKASSKTTSATQLVTKQATKRLTKQETKPSKQDPKLIQSKISKRAIEKANKESW